VTSPILLVHGRARTYVCINRRDGNKRFSHETIVKWSLSCRTEGENKTRENHYVSFARLCYELLFMDINKYVSRTDKTEFIAGAVQKRQGLPARLELSHDRRRKDEWKTKKWKNYNYSETVYVASVRVQRVYTYTCTLDAPRETRQNNISSEI